MTTVEHQAYTSADAAAQTTITLSTRAPACTRVIDYSNEWRRSAVKLPGLSADFWHCSVESTRISRGGTRSQLERAPSITDGACYVLNVQDNSAALPLATPRYNKAASVHLGPKSTLARPDARVRWWHRPSCVPAILFNSALWLQLSVFVLFCAASPCASKSLSLTRFRCHAGTQCTCRFRRSGVATYSRAELFEGRIGSIFGQGPRNVGAPARCSLLLVPRHKAESRTRAHHAGGTSRRHVKRSHHQGKQTAECICVRSQSAGEGEWRSELAFLRACSANSADVFTWYTACRKANPPANPKKGGCPQQSDRLISAQPLRWISCGATSQAPTCKRLRQRPSAHTEDAISLRTAAVRHSRHGRKRVSKSACQKARNSLLFVPSHLLRSVLRSESCASHRNTKSRATAPTHSDAGISCVSPDVGISPCSGGPGSGASTSVEAERERQSPSGSEFLRGVDAAWNVCADSEWKTYFREQLLSDSNKRWTSSDKQDKGVKKWMLYNVQRFPTDVLSCSPTSGRLRQEQMRERDAHLERVAGEKAAAGEVEARLSKEKSERQRSRKLTWKDYLSWLPPPQPQHNSQWSRRRIRNFQETKKCEEPGDQTSFIRSCGSKKEEDAYDEWEGFPPSASTQIDDLPLESLTWSNMTILYRQPFKEAPMIIDEETFRRLESRWTDAELKRVQREEKEAYGIPEDVPDDCWIPISPSIPEGRLVQEYGLLPNITLTAGGFDYIETYHDPERNYTWSYKRWNPMKQEGEPPRNLEAEARSIYELETERSRRYWHEEAHPPLLKPDDGIFRQVTIGDEMIKGMKRTPLGMDQWHYTPTHPLGQAAELQNFWLTAIKSTLPEATTRVAAEVRTAGAAVHAAVFLSKNGSLTSPVASDFTSEQAPTLGLPVSVRFPAADGKPAAKSDVVFRRVSSETVAATDTSRACHLEPGVKVVPHLTYKPLAILGQRGSRNGSTGATELPDLEEHQLQRDHAANTSCKRCKTASETETIIREAVGDLSAPTSKALAQLGGAVGVTTTPTKVAPGAEFTYRSGARTFRVNRSAYQSLVFSEAENGDLGATGVADDMKYRRLGRSDLFVSEVGLGTMTVGSPPLNENRTKQLLTYAVDVWGVNFIDTAELYPLPAALHTYGKAEEIIGQWLRSTGRRSGRGRKELIIATKVAGPSSKLAWLRGGGNSRVYPPEKCSADEEPHEATRRRELDASRVFVASRALRAAERARGAWTKSCRGVANAYEGTSLSKTQIVQAAEASLRRLQTDYIDLFQLHWPDRYVPMQRSGDAAEVLYDPEEARLQEAARDSVSMEEQLDAIKELLRQGKIRAWGLCNETPYGVCRFTRLATKIGLPPPASVQLQYNLLCRNDVEKGFVELARPQNAGTGLLAYGALAGGVLTGKYVEWLEKPTTGRMLRFPSYMKRYRGSLAARAVAAYYYLALRLGHPNLTAMALRWVLTRPFICSTLLGFTDYYQLRENLYCTHQVCGITSDWAEREINFLHWKWRDPLRTIQ